MNKNTGGPAFPGVDESGDPYNGMTLRDYFAAKAMQAFVSSPNATQEWIQACAVASSYAIADAMLKEREK